MTDNFISAADQRQMQEHAEELERLPISRWGWAATNRALLLAAGLPASNELVNERLAPPSTRCFIRLTAAARDTACDILASAVLVRELPANLAALGGMHLLERTRDGLWKLHKLTLSYPNRFDLLDD
jgi:hypothetical protein